MTGRGWSAPPAPPADAEQPLDPFALVLRDHLIDAIRTAAATSPRSLQMSVGASEIGDECERRIAYRAVGAPPVHHTDPMRSMAGSGIHEVLAAAFTRLDQGSGRYLVEQAVEYRGIPGSVDLYDRWRRVVVDWKSPLKDGVRRVRSNGPSAKYVTQVHIYGTALRHAGEKVDSVALAFLPTDGELTDLHLWTQPLRPEVADQAIDRYERVAAQARAYGPDSLPHKPSRLCGWCANYRPGAHPSAVACPGNVNS